MGLTREEALKIMGLEEGCTTKEIRDRFKKLALKWHPDKNIDNPDEAQKKFQAISAAYTKLVSSDTEEEDDDIPNDYLREMFARIWQSHNRGAFSSDPHLFCDCDECQADWEDLSLEDFIGSDSDPDDDFYYDDSLYADDLLRQFGEKLYRKYNEPPVRAEKKAKQMWTGSGYRESMTAEQASKNAEELLEAEEREKRAAEKKKKRNRKKKESKKRRKAKQEDGDLEETPPPEQQQQQHENKEKNAVEEEQQPQQEEEEEEERETTKEEQDPNEANGGRETETVQQADIVNNTRSKTSGNDKANGRQSEATKTAAAASGSVLADATVNKKGRDAEDEEGEREEDEDSIQSEDELDYNSAFLSRAKVLVAAKGSKTKDKKPPATEKWQEAKKKRNVTEQKTSNTKPDSGHFEPKPRRNRFKIRPQQQQQSQPQQGRNPRTANRGPGHSKLAAGINGSAPVFSASNGYEEASAVAAVAVVEEEEEEEDLSPVDMSQAKLYEANIPQSKLLAGEGNRAAKAGEFVEAVHKYSEAISLYPFDHRYFGNRSFCYDYLQDYAKALADANSALRIDINWAKGFYRRGRGLAGLKRYEAAVTAFTRALDLNPEYAEAREQLEMVQLEQLQGMGFPLEASKATLAEYHTVPAAIEAMVKGGGGSGGGGGSKKHKQRSEYTPVYNHSGYEIPPRMLPQTAPPKNCSLWVGNINSRSVTQSMITNLFQKHGQVLSVRVLYERRCAFVNYARPESAAAALKKLQGHTVGDCCLLLRYPENNTTKSSASHPPQPSGPPRSRRGKPGPATEECVFWRSSGCSYGDQCRYLHLPESQGVDSSYYGDHPSQ